VSWIMKVVEFGGEGLPFGKCCELLLGCLFAWELWIFAVRMLAIA